VRCSRSTVYASMPNVVSIGLFCRPLAAKTPEFCRFWTSAFCGVASCLLSNDIKIVAVLQRLYGEIVRRISIVHRRDGQTDKPTKHSTHLAAPATAEILASPTVGMVIEDLEHVLAPRKLLAALYIVSALGGAENWGNPTPST